MAVRTRACTSTVPGPSADPGDLERMRPGPELAVSLAGRDPTAVGDDELTDVLRGYRRLASWAQAAELAAVGELARRRDAEDRERRRREGSVGVRYEPVDAVVDEVALALTLTVASSDAWVELARDLTGRLSGTSRALADGRIDLARARAVSSGLLGLDDGLARRIEERVLAQAEEQTTGGLRDRIRRMVRAADPEAAERRRRRAEKERRVGLAETSAGTSDLAGYDLPADAASAAYGTVNAIAHALAADGDARGIDQIRADVFLDLLRGRSLPQAAQATSHASDTPQPSPAPRDTAAAAAGGGGPDADEPTVAAMMAAGAVADKIAAAIAETLGRQLADVRDLPRVAALRAASTKNRRGGAAVLVEAAARRMAEAIADLKLSWCDAVTRPSDHDATTGNPTDDRAVHGHGGYRPPAHMRRLIQTRDRRCVFPTCRRPATQCDLDHSLAFHCRGTTCPCNLAALCRRHHILKQDKRWQVMQPWPGVIIWITPGGRWHIARPDRE